MPCDRPEKQRKSKQRKSKFDYTDKSEIAVSPKAAHEQDKQKLASVLAQIDLASCFRNEEEPLFAILSPLIYEHLAK